MNDARLTVVTDQQGLVDIGPEWDELLPRSENDNPFLDHARSLAWWRAYAPADSLRMLTYRDPGTDALVGILPLFRDRRRGVPPVQCLRLIGTVGGAGFGPIVLSEYAPMLLRRMADDLAAQRVRWDVLDLRVVRDADTFTERLSDATGCGHCVVEATRHVCPTIDLPPTWDAYLATLSRGMRQEIRNFRGKAERAGLELETITDPAALPQAIGDLLVLFERRMHDKVGRGYVVHGCYRDFMLDMSASLLARGRLRLRFLKSDGRRVACIHQIRHGSTMYATTQSFDADFAKLRVSSVLIGYAVENAIAEGCDVYDFLLGADAYKMRWGARPVNCFSDVHAYADTVAGALRRRVDDASRSAAGVARQAPGPVRDRVASMVRAARRASR